MPQLSRSLVHEIPCPADGQTSAPQMARAGEAGLCFHALERCMTLQQLQHSRRSFATLPAPSHGATQAATPAPSHYGNAPQIVTSREVARFFLCNTINRVRLCFHAFFLPLQKQEKLNFFLKQGRHSQPFPGCSKNNQEILAIKTRGWRALRSMSIPALRVRHTVGSCLVQT